MTTTLVLLRHGQSTWNDENRFTGWWDADLTDRGREEAVAAGRLIGDARLAPAVVHTSLQVRAIRTAQLALDEVDLLWLPVHRSWRLNERHYGDLTGRDKKQAVEQYGADQVHVWRRSYDMAPAPISPDNSWNPNHDPRYRGLPAELVPLGECLKDVVERMLPYWYDAIVPDLAAYGTVLVAAHGNSLRALVKHLDGISDTAIAELNIPTGIPLVYELDETFAPADARPILQRYLGDPAAASTAAAAVARQTGHA